MNALVLVALAAICTGACGKITPVGGNDAPAGCVGLNVLCRTCQFGYRTPPSGCARTCDCEDPPLGCAADGDGGM